MSAFWVGIIGVVVGGGIQMLSDFLKHRRENMSQKVTDEKRKSYLREMLDNPGPTGWRTMGTLSGVIGASRDETARLLIEVGARASETGNDTWAYTKDKPLP
jgi:hypothetical protein